MNNILKNKKQLEDYLNDFHPDKKQEVLQLFENEKFDKGVTVFREQMRSLIKMPKFGKKTLIYWTSRGWSKEESLLKRVPTIRDVSSSPMNINFWLNKGFTEEESNFKIKSQRKMNKEYWIVRGFSEEDSIQKTKEFQKNSSEHFVSKLENDPIYKKMIDSKRSNNINYWLNMGFDEEESKLKLSERQTTFSLQKCIDKHGEENGRRVWLDRQEKWQKSLKESEYNGFDGKDTKSIDFFKNKYGDEWLERYIENISFKCKEDIRYLLSFVDYKEMILTLINNNLKLGHISYRLRYSILQEIYNVNKDEMYSFLMDNYEIDYGRPSYFERIHGENWLNEFIKSNTYKNIDEVLLLLSFEDYFKMIDYLIDNFSITNIVLKIKNVVISYFYKTTYEDMFIYLMSVNPSIKSNYGYMRYYNNHLCRSSGEFTIAKFLKDNNIEYIYEKKYPNSQKRCDFYLIDKDMYIEYTGMSKIKKYRNKYDEKLLFCIDNNIKHLFSCNIQDIECEIKSIYGI
jgi:hypothetical protein